MRRAALAGLLFFVASTANAADPTLAINGHVQHTQSLTLADLKALPATQIDVSFDSEHGKMTGHYTGVLVWALLDRAGLPDEGPKAKHHLQRSVIVTGSDGYQVALSIGELDPDFEAKQAIIAYARDGQPESGLRLVVPGDHKAGRSVRDVASLEVE